MDKIKYSAYIVSFCCPLAVDACKRQPSLSMRRTEPSSSQQRLELARRFVDHKQEVGRGKKKKKNGLCDSVCDPVAAAAVWRHQHGGSRSRKMKKRYVDANRLRKMKKLKITEKLSERFAARRAASPGCCFCCALCVTYIYIFSAVVIPLTCLPHIPFPTPVSRLKPPSLELFFFFFFSLNHRHKLTLADIVYRERLHLCFSRHLLVSCFI